jgi:hypothetical protein
MDYNFGYDVDLNDYETLQELVHPELQYLDNPLEDVDDFDTEYDEYDGELVETKELVTY